MNFCTKCGNPLESGLKFCTGCGSPVATALATSVPAQPADAPPAEKAEASLAGEWLTSPVSATPPPQGEWEAIGTTISDAPSRPAEVAPAGEWQSMAPTPAQVPPVQRQAPPVSPSVAPEPQPAANWRPTPPVPAGVAPVQPTTSSKSSCLPALLIGLAVLALIAVLVVGGVVYVGYKVKQKATALLHQADAALPEGRQADVPSTPGHSDEKPGTPAANPPNGAAGLLEGFASMINGDQDQGDPVESVSERDHVEPCAPSAYPAQTGARIPLEQGTVITNSWGIVYQDVESTLSIRELTPASLELTSDTPKFKQDDGSEQGASSHQTTVCNDDVRSGIKYITENGTHVPPLVHGATRLRLSDKSFGEIKSTGKISMDYLSFQSYDDAEKPYHDVGVLTRVEPEDVPYPMIVNDERVTLPAIHLAGITDSPSPDPRPRKYRPNHSQSELYVIDDPLDPLVLLWRVKDPVYHDGKFRLEVVKIDFKVAKAVNTVEKQLTEQKRAVTYGIYFDFNKDTIKPESEKVLNEIVQAMTDNPDWKLTVEGHTDNIGGDAYNLDLSKRRAAAVKQALVDRYHIAPERLSTNGFGASRPIETNDTLEGRARNRRVELTRE